VARECSIDPFVVNFPEVFVWHHVERCATINHSLISGRLHLPITHLDVVELNLPEVWIGKIMPVQRTFSVFGEIKAAHLDLGLSIWIHEHGESVPIDCITVEQSWNKELCVSVLGRWRETDDTCASKSVQLSLTNDSLEPEIWHASIASHAHVSVLLETHMIDASVSIDSSLAVSKYGYAVIDLDP